MSASKWDNIQKLADLGLEMFWLPANTKVPTLKGWPEKATNDLTRVASWFGPNGSHVDGNYAVKGGTERKNPETGETEWLTIIDLDVKGGKDGVRSLTDACSTAGIHLRDFPTFAVRTGSGGQHLYYWSAQPIAHGTDVLGEGSGVDIRSDSASGYVVGPGSVVDGNDYTVVKDVPIASMGALASIFPTKTSATKKNSDAKPLAGIDSQRAEDRARDYLRTAPLAVEGSGGDQTTYKVAARLKDLGCDQVQAEELMLANWNDRSTPPWNDSDLREKVAHAYRYGVEQPGIAAPEAVFTEAPAVSGADVVVHPLDVLNQRYAYVKAGYILEETTDGDGKPAIERWSVSEFRDWFRNKPKFQAGDEKPRSLADAWLDWPKRREFERETFSPGRPCAVGNYNLFRGFTVEPAANSDHPGVSRWREHMLENICDGDGQLCRWLVGYFAHLFQKPWEKAKTCVALKGGKGVGKNVAVDPIMYLLGCHSIISANRRYLLGNFNAHFENNLLFVADEMVWPGLKEADSQLKGLITGDQHVIERKGLESRSLPNLSRVVIIGNADWLVPASYDERRYAVFAVGDGRKQDQRYFDQLRVWMEQGGYAHLLRFLLDYDLAGINVQKAPDTRGLAEQKYESLTGAALFWWECADGARIGETPWADGARVQRSNIYQCYERLHKGDRYRYPHMSETAFWRSSLKLLKLRAREVRVDGRRAIDLIPLAHLRSLLHKDMGVQDVWTEDVQEYAEARVVSTAADLFAETCIFD